MNALPSKTDCKVAGVILAAGSFSRIGQFRQLLAFRETTVLGQVIENATGSLPGRGRK